MKTRKIPYALIPIFLLVITGMSGCSKSGGGEAATSPPLSAAVVTTTGGVLKLGAVGDAADLIAGIDVRVNLPAGVTVDSDPATGETAAGAVAISGAAADNGLLAAKYTPADGRTSASLHIIVANAAGFHPGEFATVRFNLAEGTSLPAVGAFVMTNFSAKGPDSSALSGIIAAPLSVSGAENTAAKKAQVIIVAPPPDNYVTLMIDTPTRYTSQTIGGTVDPGLTAPVITTFPSATISAVTVTGNSWSAQISGLSEGDNIITVTTTTNGELVSVTGTIVVDTMKPDLTVDYIAGTRDSFKTITGTVDDPPYHIVAVEVQCDSATAGMAVVAVPFWSAMITDLYYGNNHCTVTATDAAGNHSTKDLYVYYDNIAPYLDIHVNALAKYNSVQYIYGTVDSGVTPTVTASGGSAVISAVTVTGSNWSTYIRGLQEGDNIITVTAGDLYGNIITKTATITIYACNGSFSGAGQPTVTDALYALRIAAGIIVPNAEDLIRGDLYDDGLNKIDVADVVLILKAAVGLFDNNLQFNNIYPQLLQ